MKLFLSPVIAQSTNLDINSKISTIRNIFIKVFGSWYPTSENLLEVAALTLSGILTVFIIVVLKANRKLRKKEKELEKQYEKVEEQYQTLLNIKEDVRAGKKFELGVESASDQIVITDPEGIILYANPAVKEISGFDPQMILGKKAGSKRLWGGQMDPEFYKNFWQTIKVEKKSFKGTFENKKKDGTKYYAQTTVSPVLNRSGGVKFFVGIERDITKEKKVEKMKDEFISLASHQLRTPLSAIRWYLEMLFDGDAGKLTDEQEKYATNVYESNQRMINLVNALLNVSKIETGKIAIKPKPTNIVKLVDQILEELNSEIESKNQKVIFSANQNIPPIELDPKLIRNVYSNLIINASKYSPPASTLEIFISKNNEEVISQISDHGYGIPEEEHKRVFQKFFRAHNAVKAEPSGTGLGLYLSKTIVETFGGKIWFESNKEGTTFWFTIPLNGVKTKKGATNLIS